jgi:hypothetical protein
MIHLNPRGALASLILAAVCTAGAGAQSAAPVAVVSLEPYQGNSGLLTVRASVNGHDRTFAFDSGEGVSMISPELAREIGCKPWGQVTGFRMNGERIDTPHCDNITFDVAGQHFSAPTVIVYDLMKFFKSGQPRLDGSLGFDLFAGRAITFEFSRQSIVVESPASLAARIANGTEVPIRIVRDAEGLALTVDVGVPTSEGMAWMELDSGGGNSIIIGKHVAALFKLDPESRAVQQVTFTLAGKISLTAPARVMDHMIMDGNINVPFLQKWDVTLDLARGRAWVAPAGRATR